MLMLASIGFAQEVNPDRRLEHATAALRVFLSADSNVPKDLAGKAQCIVVVPHLAFLVGGKYGRGFASCRKASGGWTAPGAIAMEGSGAATDLIVLVMNESGMKGLLGDAAVAVDPEMISYSRAKELFVGVSLEGATMRPDGGENKKLYGHEVSNGEILMGKVVAPKGARAFVAVLNKRARKGK
jgi:SH3 domain-containing YSC84-like protein 1